MAQHEELVQRLVDEVFPWERPGFPPKPQGQSWRQQTVELWLKERTLPFRSLALVLVARTTAILREREMATRSREGSRLLARIDTSAILKTPASILEKLARRWEEAGSSAPPVDFHNFLEELTDLGRFRVVANFLSDAEEIANTLEEPFLPGPPAPLTGAQLALSREFLLKKNSFERSFHFVATHNKDRTRMDPHAGARSAKGVFHRRDDPLHKVEIQIQTQLQEGWDKKEHSLVYERERRREEVDPRYRSEMIAMSHLLYIADCSFDRLREAMLAAREGK